VAETVLKPTFALLLLTPLLILPGCKPGGTPATDNANAAVKIGANDYVIAHTQQITTGPVITGTLAATKEANVRAEVPGPLLDVRAGEGERVTKGELLARIGPGAINAQQSSQTTAIASLRNNLTWLSGSSIVRTLRPPGQADSSAQRGAGGLTALDTRIHLKHLYPRIQP
jgi:multidrug efflux pump subunit AcrA (membrane-fusion protein)